MSHHMPTLQCYVTAVWLSVTATKHGLKSVVLLCNLLGYCLRQKEAKTIQYHPRKAEQRDMMVWMLQFVINSTWRGNMREKQKQSKQWQSLEIHRPLSKHIGWNISVVSSQEEERREQKQDWEIQQRDSTFLYSWNRLLWNQPQFWYYQLLPHSIIS